ncbi:MAG: type II toxin-antitoxin system VapC family toxin [Mangrovibacterium sp.]
MAKVVCDTDVLIDYFDESKPRHLDTVRELEENIKLDNVLISAVTKMELILGAANKRELNAINKKLSRFSILLFNQEITSLSINILQTYRLSHGLAIPDCLIAASTIQSGLQLFTYNIKDFKFIPKLELYQH